MPSTDSRHVVFWLGCGACQWHCCCHLSSFIAATAGRKDRPVAVWVLNSTAGGRQNLLPCIKLCCSMPSLSPNHSNLQALCQVIVACRCKCNVQPGDDCGKCMLVYRRENASQEGPRLRKLLYSFEIYFQLLAMPPCRIFAELCTQRNEYAQKKKKSERWGLTTSNKPRRKLCDQTESTSAHLDGHAGAMESLREEDLLATQAMEGTCKLQLQSGTSMAAII